MQNSTGIVAVTGAAGFVGRALVQGLSGDPEMSARALVSVAPEGWTQECIAVGRLETSTRLEEALSGVEVVVHCAGRAHVLNDSSPDPLSAYRRTNVTGTENLVVAAQRAGVRRIVFLSSVKVNGETTPKDRPFTSDDPPHPLDAYGQSKLEAEEVIRAAENNSDLEAVILRPPLIYGPGVKGNMLRLANLVRSGVPIPLGAVDNRRSFVGMDNLVSAVKLLARHPAAPGRTFLVSDQYDISTPELIGYMADALRRRPNLWTVPIPLLKAVAKLSGRLEAIDRLVGSLRVDSQDLTRVTGWLPLIGISEGIRRTILPERNV